MQHFTSRPSDAPGGGGGGGGERVEELKGWLHKQSTNGRWQRRYFILRDQKLERGRGADGPGERDGPSGRGRGFAAGGEARPSATERDLGEDDARPRQYARPSVGPRAPRSFLRGSSSSAPEARAASKTLAGTTASPRTRSPAARSSSRAARALGAAPRAAWGGGRVRFPLTPRRPQAAKAHKDAERDFVIRIETEERPYHLAAGSGDDMSNWLLALRGHCGR